MVVWVEVREHTFVPSIVYDDVEGSIGPYRFKVRVHRFDPGRKKSKCTCMAMRTGIREEKGSLQSPALPRIGLCSALYQLAWQRPRHELGLVFGSDLVGTELALPAAI